MFIKYRQKRVKLFKDSVKIWILVLNFSVGVNNESKLLFVKNKHTCTKDITL